MDYSVTFARHFSRLVWLLAHEPESVDEQKAALRAAVTVSRTGVVTLRAEGGQLVVNGSPLPEALTGVQDLVTTFTGHAVNEMIVDMGALPADILGTARILGAVPVQTGADQGKEVDTKLRALAPRTVRVSLRRVRRTSTPLGVPVIPNGARNGTPTGVPAQAPAPAAAPAAPAAPVPPRRPDDFSYDVRSEIVREFTTLDRKNESPEELFAKLDATNSVSATSRLLDVLVGMIETSARESKPLRVADLFLALVRREASKTDPEVKRAFAAAIRRLCKPTTLRVVAGILPKRKEHVNDYLIVLARTGEEGAEALIEQLTAAQSLSERRIYFDALVTLKAGTSTLTHMLGDARWYVARNAADLLGELNCLEAESPLADLLRHDDDRVRRAATNALAKLGTPQSRLALKKALKDTSPQVRATAAAGLVGKNGKETAATLLRALDSEPDLEVQIAILGALGRMADPESVDRLIKAAEPEGRLFRRKPTAFRIAAVAALGDARTPPALTALQELTNDRDKDVRDAAARALGQAPRERVTAS
jgi:HEAT repeat protein